MSCRETIRVIGASRGFRTDEVGLRCWLRGLGDQDLVEDSGGWRNVAPCIRHVTLNGSARQGFFHVPE